VASGAKPEADAPAPDAAGDTTTEQVSAAIALGWQMAELYHAEPPPAEELQVRAEDLPGVGKLLPPEKDALGMAQLLRGLKNLAAWTADEELEELHGKVEKALENVRPPADLRSLHVAILSALTVADFRLGKAYSLGRALCEVCRASQSDAALERHLDEKHLRKLIAWCADLKSVLPDHAGQAVADSLRRWQSWGRQKPWNLVERADFDRRLSRQGERWRAILTGEKKARDLLTSATYIRAGEELLSDAAAVTVSFVKRFWAPVLLAVILLAGGIVAILLGGNGVIGGLASIAAALGISWKTAIPTLSKIGENLSGPLWEAELDQAITVAVTDPIVPATSAAPPSAEQPVPVLHATDARTTRMAARQVWKRLDRATKSVALTGRKPLTRLGYRYSGIWRGGARSAFMPRDIYLNHVQSALEARIASKSLESHASSRDELFSEFGPNDWEWIKTVVQGGLMMLEGKHDFGLDPQEQAMEDHVRVVLFGDWATGTPLAQSLAEQITGVLTSTEEGRERHLIHLGDVYYCGEPDEYERRFLRYWPARDDGLGTTSWNLNGNHDMYSGGHGYFGLIAGEAEPRTLASGPAPPQAAVAEGAAAPAEAEAAPGAARGAFAQQQGTSFFRIYNDHWQIIGLDSAYVDNDFDTRQLPKLKAWLGLSRDDPHPPRGGSRRKTILLSHHQLGSSRSQATVSSGIRGETADARKKGLINAWFWGHEHRAFVYKPYLGVPCPVCIGNGGVPELLSHVFTFAGAFQATVGFARKIGAVFTPERWAARAPKVEFEPKEPRVDGQGLKWAKLGFVVVDLDGPSGSAVYQEEGGATHEIKEFGA